MSEGNENAGSADGIQTTAGVGGSQQVAPQAVGADVQVVQRMMEQLMQEQRQQQQQFMATVMEQMQHLCASQALAVEQIIKAQGAVPPSPEPVRVENRRQQEVFARSTTPEPLTQVGKSIADMELLVDRTRLVEENQRLQAELKRSQESSQPAIGHKRSDDKLPVPRFDPKSEEDSRTYLARVEKVARSRDQPCHEVMLRGLQGEASSWLFDRLNKSWEEIKQEFCAEYPPAMITDLFELAHVEEDADMRTCLKQFKKFVTTDPEVGIESKAAKTILLKMCARLDNALSSTLVAQSEAGNSVDAMWRIAYQHAQLRSQAKTKRKEKRSSSESGKSGGGTSQRTSQKAPQTKPEERRATSPGACFNCGEFGHRKAECPKLSNANSAAAPKSTA
eukprot:TRINITY_DN1038_c0_g1_i1.p1 TRINITY_DN1038_c0_g1~~TRINITY_DN1038_c0_g1_i1.p1  ORF type:complete len:408 (+),score=82.73 TRINITY_DN1038_c0_g1_i1:51-1226(+)